MAPYEADGTIIRDGNGGMADNLAAPPAAQREAHMQTFVAQRDDHRSPRGVDARAATIIFELGHGTNNNVE